MEINNIYLGDAYELIKQVPDKSIDLIVTDPPYLIKNLEAKSEKPTGMFKTRKKTHYNEMNKMGLGNGIDLSILDELVRVMKKINIYIWCNKEQIYDYLTYFVKERNCHWEMLIWAKDNPPPFVGGHYLNDKEYCLYFWEKGVKLKPSFETGRTVYLTKTNVEDKKQYGHPTIKPIEIIENLIRNSSGGGCIILDPFLGSGTTCVAAKNLGRQFIGFEVNEKYFKIAQDRLNGINQKGQMSLLDTDFEQLNLFEDTDMG